MAWGGTLRMGTVALLPHPTPFLMERLAPLTCFVNVHVCACAPPPHTHTSYTHKHRAYGTRAW